MPIQFRDPYQYRLAMLESSLDPSAQNPDSSAKGLFQFTDGTAQQYGLQDPTDPEQAMDAEEKLRADNVKALTEALGRAPSPGETYLAHQQGADGAAKLLANPDKPAVEVVGGDEVTKNGGSADISAKDFANKWVSKFEDGYDPDSSTSGVSVRMPDGTIIANVPEGTSKEDLKAKLEAKGVWKPEWDGAAAAPAAQEAPAADAPVAPAAAAPVVPATSNPPGMGTDNTPASVAAADARMADIAKNGYKGEPNKIVGALSKFANGTPYTMGFGDEISGAMAAPAIALGTGQGLGQSYDQAVGDIRGNMHQLEKDDPLTGMGLELGGALLGGKELAGNLEALGQKVAPNAMSALAKFAGNNPKLAGTGIAAATGGLYGLGNGEGDLEDRAGGAGLSAAISAPFGAVGGALAKYLGSKGIGAAAPAMDDAAAAMAPQAEAPAAQSALAKLSGLMKPATLDDAAGTLAPEQLDRANVLKSVGIDNPTAAMISRDPATWQFERNTAGLTNSDVGNDIRNRYVQSNQAIKDAMEGLGKSFGGKAGTPREAGESVIDAVNAKSKEMQDTVGKLYSKIRDEKGAETGLMPLHLTNALDVASDNAYADTIVNSMTRKMKRYGLIDGTGAPVEGATINVNQAEELRKFANSMRGDRQTDKVVGNIIDALDDDVVETAGKDSFTEARDAARNRFKEFESNLLGGITEGKVIPEAAMQKIVFSGKTGLKDVEALKNSLLSGDEDQVARGTQAWSDLKLQALQHIMDKSTDAGGKLHGTNLTKQLDSIGKERLETLFDPDELLRLKTIQKAAEYTSVDVPESFVNHSNTASALSNIIETSGLGNGMSKAGNVLASLPFGLGVPGSVAGAVLRGGGNAMKGAAQSRSINNTLNPFGSALSRYTNPNAVLTGGGLGGALGQQFAPGNE